MDPGDYQRFTQDLLTAISEDDRVLGLVAVGSMADTDHPPDEWSDHDFFLVVWSGEQEPFRTDLGWLPRAGEIAFTYRETEHGVKALYRSGHLLEFAVFDLEEMQCARVNSHRLLLDRGGVAEAIASIVSRTGEESQRHHTDDLWLLGQFLTNLLVGVGRHRRGERLSAHHMVRVHALGHLVTLIERHVPPARGDALDGIDPTRRFEMAYPELGRSIDRALRCEVPEAALRLLALAETELGEILARHAEHGVEIIRRAIG